MVGTLPVSYVSNLAILTIFFDLGSSTTILKPLPPSFKSFPETLKQNWRKKNKTCQWNSFPRKKKCEKDFNTIPLLLMFIRFVFYILFESNLPIWHSRWPGGRNPNRASEQPTTTTGYLLTGYMLHNLRQSLHVKR